MYNNSGLLASRPLIALENAQTPTPLEILQAYSPPRSPQRHRLLRITPVQRANLRRAAEFIVTLPLSRFSMVRYGSLLQNGYPPRGHWETEHVCGSVGCIIGSAPSCVGLEAHHGETYVVYTVRVFGINVHKTYSTWSWLFDAEWAYKDNTALGAAKRIIYTLEFGVPANSEGQVHGYDPICYE